ncbi:MAG: hypothetical protein HY362_04255 [Candidatus Aenigmarchaeota archaeon]|nr:hypothetical protein [Candidatus Aenigmarchaeota archaeon]
MKVNFVRVSDPMFLTTDHGYHVWVDSLKPFVKLTGVVEGKTVYPREVRGGYATDPKLGRSASGLDRVDRRAMDIFKEILLAERVRYVEDDMEPHVEGIDIKSLAGKFNFSHGGTEYKAVPRWFLLGYSPDHALSLTLAPGTPDRLRLTTVYQYSNKGVEDRSQFNRAVRKVVPADVHFGVVPFPKGKATVVPPPFIIH